MNELMFLLSVFGFLLFTTVIGFYIAFTIPENLSRMILALILIGTGLNVLARLLQWVGKKMQ